MLHKTIIQGKIEFGTEKSFSKARKMYVYRAENYHKSETLFEAEEIFFEEGFLLSIPRFVKQTYDKAYRNTVSLLQYCTQFGISGEINAWLIHEGTILNFANMQPDSEKIAVQNYIKGADLVSQEGKEEDAIALLTKAIEKYDRHAQAYQKRAKVNVILKRHHDAMRDYTKSVNLDDSNPYSFYGRAKVHMFNEDYDKAVLDFNEALKKSVALQAVYWKARRLKAKCHIELKQYEEAAFDLKLFCNRKFPENNPNFPWIKSATFDYGVVLMELEDYERAIEMLDKAMELEGGYGTVQRSDLLRNRAIARQKSGKNGHIKDLKEAADLGDREAATLLKAYS